MCLFTLCVREVEKSLSRVGLLIVKHVRPMPMWMRSLLGSWVPSLSCGDQAPGHTVASREVPLLGCGALILVCLDLPTEAS